MNTHALPLDVVCPGNPAQAKNLLARAVLQDPSHRCLDEAAAQGDDWLETRWTVPKNPALFRGSEEAQILPGTTTTEHVVQSGELLIFALRGETTAEEGVPVLTRIRQAKFKRMVRAGDALKTRVRLLDQLGPIYRVRGRVEVAGAVALEVDLDFAATKALARSAKPG